MAHFHQMTGRGRSERAGGRRGERGALPRVSPKIITGPQPAAEEPKSPVAQAEVDLQPPPPDVLPAKPFLRKHRRTQPNAVPASPNVDNTPTERMAPVEDDQSVVIPSFHPGVNQYAPQIVVHHDRGSVVTEQYRAIRLQILARCRNRKLQTHVITSSAPDEGKTVTAVNLALAFAELKNKRTLLIEGDLRRPSFHHAIGTHATPGLLHLLRGELDDVDDAIHDTAYDNVQIMPAGDHGTTQSTELVSNLRMPQILDQLKERYDHIFIDTPPVISVTDACIFGAACDEVLLVVRLNKTPVEVVDRTKRLLKASNCDVAGVVLTHMRYHIPKYLYRYV